MKILLFSGSHQPTSDVALVLKEKKKQKIRIYSN